MERNILITGLGLGTDLLEGSKSQNIDFDTLVLKPQVLLWADKVIITSEATRYVNYCAEKKGKNLHHRLTEKVYACLDKNNMLDEKKFDIDEDKNNITKIEQKISIDLDTIKKSSILKTETSELPGGVKLGNYDYCFPRIFSFYRSAYFADKWNATIIADEEFTNYFLAANNRYMSKVKTDVATHQALTTILSWKLPPFHLKCLGVENKCSSCKHKDVSISTNIDKLDKLLNEYLKYRNFDEIYQIREVVNGILYDYEYGFLTVDEIVDKYKEAELSIKAKNAKIFKYADKISNFLFGASIAVPILGQIIPTIGAYCDPITTGAMSGTASKFVDKIKDAHRKKTNWVSFKA